MVFALRDVLLAVLGKRMNISSTIAGPIGLAHKPMPSRNKKVARQTYEQFRTQA
jgi:hypothetical protein